MCSNTWIKHDKIDFSSPKLKEVYKIIEKELIIIADKMCEPFEAFKNAYRKGQVRVGVFTTPCGKSCIFIEHNKIQLLAPLVQTH